MSLRIWGEKTRLFITEALATGTPLATVWAVDARRELKLR